MYSAARANTGSAMCAAAIEAVAAAASVFCTFKAERAPRKILEMRGDAGQGRYVTDEITPKWMSRVRREARLKVV